MADRYQTSGIPFLRSQDINPFAIDRSKIKYIDVHFDAELRKSKLRKNDVVIVRTGYPGTAAVVPSELDGANCADLVILTPGKNLDSWFTAALLNSAWGRGVVAGNLVGVAQQHFNVGAAKALQFDFPSLHVQRRIGGVVKTYCDLIEINARRIAILEELALRLFDEWFIKDAEACDKEQRRIVPAEDVIEFDPKTTVLKEGGKPFVPMTALSTSSMIIGGVERRSGNSGSKFQRADTLFARITPCLENGKTGFVGFLAEGEVGFGSTEFVVMRGRKASPEWVYLLARSAPFRAHAIKSMGGATGRQRVRQESLKSFPIVEPDPDAMDRFTRKVRPMFELVQRLARANENLRASRDLLLPKLISGEIGLERAECETAERAAAE